MKDSILVTGGAGYIGSHTCKALARAGYQPVTYDNLSQGCAHFVKWGPLVVGDLRDAHCIEHALATYRPRAVIHLAASTSVSESTERPAEYFNNNVGGTLSLLDAMQRQKVELLIFSSTCAIFGEHGRSVVAENCPMAPANPYAMSKMIVEQVLDSIAGCGGIKFVSLRYFNAAGADAEGEIGPRHDAATHLIPLAITAGLGGKLLRIFGTDYPTPDGTAVRDYVHVSDLAAAHVDALAHLAAGNESDCFNLGMGRGHSVKEVVETIIHLGIPVRFSMAPPRAGDVASLVADSRKARRVLGWSPQYTDLESIVLTAIAWHKNSPRYAGAHSAA